MTEPDAAPVRRPAGAAGRKAARGHAATGGRILFAGLGTAATVALAALMSRADAASVQALPGAAEIPAVTAPALSPTPQTVIRVVVRRRVPTEAAGPAPVVDRRSGPSTAIPRPAPPPAPAAAPPVARSHAS